MKLKLTEFHAHCFNKGVGTGWNPDDIGSVLIWEENANFGTNRYSVVIIADEPARWVWVRGSGAKAHENAEAALADLLIARFSELKSIDDITVSIDGRYSDTARVIDFMVDYPPAARTYNKEDYAAIKEFGEF